MTWKAIKFGLGLALGLGAAYVLVFVGIIGLTIGLLWLEGEYECTHPVTRRWIACSYPGAVHPGRHLEQAPPTRLVLPLEPAL
jgi:hypothetical protein